MPDSDEEILEREESWEEWSRLQAEDLFFLKDDTGLERLPVGSNLTLQLLPRIQKSRE